MFKNARSPARPVARVGGENEAEDDVVGAAVALARPRGIFEVRTDIVGQYLERAGRRRETGGRNGYVVYCRC